MRNTLFIAACAALAACNTTSFSKVLEVKPIVLSSSDIGKIESEISKNFFDPDAAKFRGLRVVEVALEGGASETRVCGEVNGKNRMGAYVGYKYFAGRLTDEKFTQENILRCDGSSQWNAPT